MAITERRQSPTRLLQSQNQHPQSPVPLLQSRSPVPRRLRSRLPDRTSPVHPRPVRPTDLQPGTVRRKRLLPDRKNGRRRRLPTTCLPARSKYPGPPSSKEGVVPKRRRLPLLPRNPRKKTPEKTTGRVAGAFFLCRGRLPSPPEFLDALKAPAKVVLAQAEFLLAPDLCPARRTTIIVGGFAAVVASAAVVQSVFNEPCLSGQARPRCGRADPVAEEPAPYLRPELPPANRTRLAIKPPSAPSGRRTGHACLHVFSSLGCFVSCGNMPPDTLFGSRP